MTRPRAGTGRLLPSWLEGYHRGLLREDVVAGLTVAVLLVPQAMAYAALAGLPPVTGLYAATLPVAVYALLGSSGQLAVGPVAIVSLLTASAVAPRAGDPGEAVAVAGLLALMVGVLQLALGLARLGRLANVLTHPVIVGFTSAAAIVIALTQLRDLLGLDVPRSENAVTALTGVLGGLGELSPWTAVTGLASVGVLLAARRVAPRLPGPLVLLVAAIGVSALLGFDRLGIPVVGDIPGGLPTPSWPSVHLGLAAQLLPAALSIALIGYAEGLSVARAIARDTGDRIGANRELVAVGAANAAAATVQAFPVAGGFSRSAVNHQAGARTPLAGLVTAGLIALVAVALTPLLYHLPRAALAAVIVVAVARLVNLGEVRRLLRVDVPSGAVAVTTFAATLLIGVEPGLGVGVVAGLALRLGRRLQRGRGAGTDRGRRGTGPRRASAPPRGEPAASPSR